MARTVPCALGHADAFVSHSWFDNSHDKFSELQAWAAEFRREQGREPLVWIDRFCVDQSNIIETLQCLPVYLAGCDTFLALCGDTYMSRLWCIVEAWVFVEMREGRHDSLALRPFGEALKILEKSRGIDVTQATCTMPEDATRLMTVLEESFGTLERCSSKLTATLLPDMVRKAKRVTAQRASTRSNRGGEE